MVGKSYHSKLRIFFQIHNPNFLLISLKKNYFRHFQGQKQKIAVCPSAFVLERPKKTVTSFFTATQDMGGPAHTEDSWAILA